MLLKADFTWEYIDLVPNTNQADEIITPPIQSPPPAIVNKINCGLAHDFKEPKLNVRVQAYLKKSRATMKDLKQKVAKDFNCTVNEITLISINESNTKGRYSFCANGKKVDYKRTGSNFFRKGKFL